MKRILIIWLAHFIVTAASVLGGTYEAAMVIREGATEISQLGSLLQISANLLAQPAASSVINIMPEGSSYLWLVLLVNSAIWAVIINFIWRKLCARPEHANT